MNVAGLRIHGGFGTHQATEIEFPSRGIVVIRGGNGSGKSSLCEAVAWAGWGEHIRPDTLWPDGAQGHVSLLTGEGLEIRREQRARGTRLYWSDLNRGLVAPQHATTTKAQEELEALLGPYDVWRRTHVLAAENIGAFSTAKDAERKRLLEVLLGVDALDGAGERASEAHQHARRALAHAESDLHAAGARVERACNALHAARVVPPAAPLPDLSALRKAGARAEYGLIQAEVAFGEVYGESARVDGLLRDAHGVQRMASQLVHGLTCPTCKRDLVQDEDTRARAHREFAAATEAFTAAQTEARAVGDAVRAARNAVDAARAVAGGAQNAVRAAELQHQHHAGATHAQARAVGLAERELDAAESALDVAASQHARAEHAEAVAKQASAALGTYGVRAHLLHGALSGIEAVANLWLARIAGPDVALRLGLKSEGRAEVTLALEGMAGGRAKSASTGQKRRVDVALLFALAEAAAGALGASRGTLFADEVFDSLDEAGRAAVCAAMDELAEERCVVVITHEEALDRGFRHVTKRLDVEHGKVTER